MTTARRPNPLGSTCSLPCVPHSLFHFFTRTFVPLPTVHCSLCSKSHWRKNPPKMVRNSLTPINLIVFYFACGSAFCNQFSAIFRRFRPLPCRPPHTWLPCRIGPGAGAFHSA